MGSLERENCFQKETSLFPEWEEGLLQALQSYAWRKPALSHQDWWVPIPDDFLKKAEDRPFKGRILVVGCGSGRELRRIKSLSSHVFCFDLNEKTVQETAREAAEIKGKPFNWPFFREASFFAANVLSLPLRMKGDFDVALMVGVGTSLIGRNLNVGLFEVASRLRPGGHLVFSDFVETLDEGSFDEKLTGPKMKRYNRDSLALHILITGNASWEAQNALEGTFIVKPRGLPWREALDLTADEVAQAVGKGDFERLAQHRGVRDFRFSLETAGFEIEDQKLIRVYPISLVKSRGQIVHEFTAPELARAAAGNERQVFGEEGFREGFCYRLVSAERKIIAPVSPDGEEMAWMVEDPVINIQILARKRPNTV